MADAQESGSVRVSMRQQNDDYNTYMKHIGR